MAASRRPRRDLRPAAAAPSEERGLSRSVFPRRFRGWLMAGVLYGYRFARVGTMAAFLCVRGKICGVLFCFILLLSVFVCLGLLVRMVLCTLCPLRLYALGISGICPVGCSCVSRVFFSLFVSGKGVSQFIRRSANALALCLARATSTVSDRRLGPVDVSSESSDVLLIDLF